MEGFMLVGFLLTAQLCKLDGDKPTECKQLQSLRVDGAVACDALMENMKASFPSIEPEMLGLPAGTRLQLNLKCGPLYQPLSA